MGWLDDRCHDSKSIQNDCKILEEKSKIIIKKPTKEYFYLSTAFLIILKIFRNTPFNKNKTKFVTSKESFGKNKIYNLIVLNYNIWNRNRHNNSLSPIVIKCIQKKVF